jgi:Xaa-Pro aminopeptidase
MSGPNARIRNAMESLVDYRHGNRFMRAGELVRVDVGCDADFYKGDVGRTVPVSGRFEPHQKEIWTLFVHAYTAGLAAIRPGARQDSVIAAAERMVAAQAHRLITAEAQQAARLILARDKAISWHLHTCGLEAGEPAVDEFREGMVVIFEPMLEVGDEAYYLEDMVLVTGTGIEILTAGLPTTADDIERAMAGTRR